MCNRETTTRVILVAAVIGAMKTSREENIRTKAVTTLVVIVAVIIEGASREEISRGKGTTMIALRRQREHQLFLGEENDHRSYVTNAGKRDTSAQTAHNNPRCVITVERKVI